MRNSNILQTPQRNQSPAIRRLKSISDPSKKFRNEIRKSLNAEFAEASVIESPKDYISEISEDNLIAKSTESFALDPVNLSSAVTFPVSHSTPLSSITTSGTDNGSTTHVETPPVKITSVESELIVKQLRESLVQVLDSDNVHSQGKKILTALVNVVIEDLYEISDDKLCNQLSSKKTLQVLLIFVLWVLGIFVIRSSASGGRRPFLGPTPT